MGDKVKKQHYVPRFYLNYFSAPEREGAVHVLMKPDGKYLGSQRVENVAAENYFHDLPDDPNQEVEKKLQEYETTFGVVLKKLTRAQSLDALSGEDRKTLTLFTAFQFMRTRKMREKIRREAEQIRNNLNSSNVVLENAYQDVLENALDFKKIHVQALIGESEAVASLLQRMSCTLLISTALSARFCVSDDPVILASKRAMFGGLSVDKSLKAQLEDILSVTGEAGLRLGNRNVNPDAFMLQPLNQSLAIAFFINESTSLLPNRVEVSREQTKVFNILQLIQAFRFVYASCNDFSFATPEIIEVSKQTNKLIEEILRLNTELYESSTEV